MVNQDTTLRLPMFHGMGKDDAEKHWFMCEAIWSVKRITDEASKICTTGDHFQRQSLMWYMKYKETVPVGQMRSLTEIKRDMLRSFRSLSQNHKCITEIKEIKQQMGETVWDYDQWFKILLDRLTFQIQYVQHRSGSL
jgi:hypothetical protein